MSEKRKIDDSELEEIAGAGELVKGEDELQPEPFTQPGGGNTQPPDTNAQGGDNQHLTE